VGFIPRHSANRLKPVSGNSCGIHPTVGVNERQAGSNPPLISKTGFSRFRITAVGFIPQKESG